MQHTLYSYSLFRIPRGLPGPTERLVRLVWSIYDFCGFTATWSRAK